MEPLAQTVNHLRLVDFRNYENLDLPLDSNLVLIEGSNGSGKSNLLEAIATATLTKSPKCQNQMELIKDNATATAIDLSLTKGEDPYLLSLRLLLGTSSRIKKQLKLNQKEKTSPEVLGFFPTVIFWPDDLTIVKGSPENRRRFLDTLSSQLSKENSKNLLNYQKVLQNRNALLKLGRRPLNEELFTVYTLKLAQIGAAIQWQRKSLLETLAPLAMSALHDLTGDQDTLDLLYLPSGQRQNRLGQTEVELTADLMETLQKEKKNEQERGLTLYGPHRDDLDLLLNQKSSKSHASQGQQRTLLLSLKLAELRYLIKVTNTVPLLLLDDVLSELDPKRKKTFLDLAVSDLNAQTFITTATPLPLIAHCQKIEIDNGKLLNPKKYLFP